MSKKYPNAYLCPFAQAIQAKYTDPTECPACGTPITIKQIFVIEVQWSWFRGDDSVEHICPKCASRYKHLEEKFDEGSAISNLYNRINALKSTPKPKGENDEK